MTTTGSELLSHRDVQRALTYMTTFGGATANPTAHDFAPLIAWREWLLGHIGESMRDGMVGQWLVTHLDYDGNGRVTDSDFLALHADMMKRIQRHQEQLDAYLPMVGRCAVGFGCGYVGGTFVRRLCASWISTAVIGGAGCMGIMYLDREGYINSTRIAQSIRTTISQQLDKDGDGQVTGNDAKAVMEGVLSPLTRKLGSPPFPTGVLGVCVFGLGFFRGLRLFRR